MLSLLSTAALLRFTAPSTWHAGRSKGLPLHADVRSGCIFPVPVLLPSAMEHARTYAALAILAVLCGAGIVRTGVFESEITMFADAAAKSPDKARPHNNLGDALRKAGRVEEAAAHFERALAIKPDYPDALNNLATVYNHYGRRQDAIALLSSCLALEPGHLQARYNLAMTYYESGMPAEAAVQYRMVMQLAPLSHEAAFARSMLSVIAREAPSR